VSASWVWLTPFWGLGFSGSGRFVTGSAYSGRSNFDFNNDGQSATDRPTLGCTSIGGSATNYDCSNGIHFGRNSFRQPSSYTVDLRLQKAPPGGDLACRGLLQLHQHWQQVRFADDLRSSRTSTTTTPNTSTPNAGSATPTTPNAAHAPGLGAVRLLKRRRKDSRLGRGQPRPIFFSGL
jgi:hypothetical protein